MGNSGWTAEPNTITIPGGAGPNDPRIVITGDPAQPFGASILFYVDADRAYRLHVDLTGGTLGEFLLTLINPQTLAELEILKASAGGGTGTQITLTHGTDALQTIVESLTNTIIRNAAGIAALNLDADNATINGQPDMPDADAICIENHGGGNPTWTGATTYTTTPGGSAAFGTSFVAPRSGLVVVSVEGWIGSNSTVVNRRSFLSFQIREGGTVGAGTIVSAANDSRAGLHDNDSAAAGFKYSYVHVRRRVAGLVAGDTYNVTTAVRIDNAGDTGATNERHALVEPRFSP